MVKEIVKQVIICDRCGKQLLTGEKIGYVAVHERLEVHGDAVNTNEFEEMDFCEECLCAITRFVAFNPNREMAGEEKTEPLGTGIISRKKKKMLLEAEGRKDAPVESDIKERKQIDYGKIMALSNAGWTNKQIAEEMGMILQQVYDAKYKARKKKAESEA